MTISSMTRALALFFAVLALVSCGTDAPEAVSSDDNAAEATQVAAEAFDSIEALEAETDELASDIADLKDHRKALSARIGKISGKLRAAIADLRSSLNDIEGDIDGAVATADDALARIGEVARDLEVLENRFDYHLREGH